MVFLVDGYWWFFLQAGVSHIQPASILKLLVGIHVICLAVDDDNDDCADPDEGLPPMLSTAPESVASTMPSPLQSLKTFRQELLAESVPR